MLPKLTIPSPEAPKPIDGYGLPDAPQLDWSFVSQQMAAARYYWISTADIDDAAAPQPHAAPLWGVWQGDRIYFDGSPRTRWARNLAGHPAIAVHPPDAENVVIIEGVARLVGDAELSAAEWAELDGTYAAKYGTPGSPRWVVEPRLVLAWAGVNLGTMTRWRFE
jgi:hypothetical protein